MEHSLKSFCEKREGKNVFSISQQRKSRCFSIFCSNTVNPGWQERWACKLPWWRSKGRLLLCVHQSLSRQGCERFCVDLLGTIDKQPPALICGRSSSLGQLSWGLILFSVSFINKVCFLYLFDLFSRLWVSHLAGMGFDFIVFAPLWASWCGSFVSGHRVSSFLVGSSVLPSIAVQ